MINGSWRAERTPYGELWAFGALFMIYFDFGGKMWHAKRLNLPRYSSKPVISHYIVQMHVRHSF